jgi:ArsR family transcriptional regulator, arsenate/arsenite/antimonite-responsive transcriptional repressor
MAKTHAKKNSAKSRPRSPRGARCLPSGAVGRPAREDRFAQSFAALGEPTRLRIMQMLPRQPICEQMYNVIELADELGLTQPTVSHHLKILSEAGLVLCRRQCNSLYFYVDQEAVIKWLHDVKSRFGCENCKS